jgi:hypothetical protein
MLYLFPVFNQSDPYADRDFPLSTVIGLTFIACFTGDMFGKSGLRGWLSSVGGVLLVVFLGASVAAGLSTIIEGLTEPDRHDIITVFLTGLALANLGFFFAIHYIADWVHLAALGLSTAAVHLVARFERRRVLNE